jgi:hypothetical protein
MKSELGEKFHNALAGIANPLDLAPLFLILSECIKLYKTPLKKSANQMVTAHP